MKIASLSVEAKSRNDRDSTEDCAGLNAIRNEIKKIWAENQGARSAADMLQAYLLHMASLPPRSVCRRRV
jgi:hypothetical protein